MSDNKTWIYLLILARLLSKEEFLTVMPLTTEFGDQRTQIDKFFMVLTLIGLRPNLETILASDNTSDSSVLVYQTNSQGGRSGNRGRGQRPHCTYCNKLGHTRDRCYQLHGRPPHTAHVAQSSNPQPPQPLSSSTSQGISLTDSEYDDYFRYQATNSGASDHISGPEYGEDDWHRTQGLITSPPLQLLLAFLPTSGLYRRHRVVVPPSLAEVPADSLPIPSTSPAPALPPFADLPIALRKGWRQAMVDEMTALHSNGTWDLVVLPSGKSTVGCRWVYTVKVGLDGQVDRLKIASVRLLLSMAAMRSWPLYQLGIKNAFLHGDLAEKFIWSNHLVLLLRGSLVKCRLRRSLYGLKQSPRAWFSRFSSVVQEFGMFRSTTDHSVFYHHNSSGQCIYLVVYVDDIVITGSDQNGIQKLKQHLFTHFQTKDLGKLKYFLGIEIAKSSSGVVFPKGRGAFRRSGRYRRLIGKLNYLTITRPDISFPISVVSQFLQSPCDSHWDAIIRILRYIKSTPGQGVLYENRGHTQVVGYIDADWVGSPIDRRSTSGYCVFIGGNLISWKSKKQDVVARSSVEAEYRVMALATCELVWLKHLLRELRFGKDKQMKLICDNQAALHIASNQSSMKGPNTLKLTVTSLERRSHHDVWRLVLSIQMIN
ncbi:Retrovirus-related Pol polyprotein from transposon RE2 [Vitis vinifera]|uniref:Retrovirus-related Pol polyprotein from transposon RE2 n=1 Tax=Vitis vinifera TaxID=29760 RepID=A0A438K3Z2_VITVI|nr:Retrovirus-related Pol polyprotein from transposon RE2 [Vitis vinifera]